MTGNPAVNEILGWTGPGRVTYLFAEMMAHNDVMKQSVPAHHAPAFQLVMA